MALATHTCIISSVQSTSPPGLASTRTQCSSTDALAHPAASVLRFSPGHLRRTITRPVSYYALFKCVAASEPTSWLSVQFHILLHLTYTLGP